ncbi:putative bifunctional transcriptional activator/DNA repair enzyme AlkA [Streptomyces antimycoticus]
MIAMRALGDPDAFVPTDLGVRRAAAELALATPGALTRHSTRWRPWRAYAVQYLWGNGRRPRHQPPAHGLTVCGQSFRGGTSQR